MELLLRAVEPKSAKQPENRDTMKYVRKSQTVFVAYYFATSLAVGLGITIAVFLFAIFDTSNHGKHQPLPARASLLFLMAVLGALSSILFLLQLITGPFVFTKDVVCKKCRIRFRVNRIAFFTGKYSRPPRCECGGKIEPAYLWKPGVCNPDSIAS